MPVHINLWLFKGLAPKNGQEVEVIIHGFKFTPGSELSRNRSASIEGFPGHEQDEGNQIFDQVVTVF
jgi:hypothetical protein